MKGKGRRRERSKKEERDASYLFHVVPNTRRPQVMQQCSNSYSSSSLLFTAYGLVCVSVFGLDSVRYWLDYNLID